MIVVILPAYNEFPALQTLLERFVCLKDTLEQPLRIVVVDDGSIDETAKCAREFQGLEVQVITHETNAGLGAAMTTGLMSAAQSCSEGDTIITMDADDTHPPSHIALMLREIENGADLVIASRYQSGARVLGLSKFRGILSTGASKLFRIFLPVPGLRDYTCGYRAYRPELLVNGFDFWRESLISEKGFSCMAEIALKLSIFRPKISEVPLHLFYDRRSTPSKMRVGRTVIETVQMIPRLRAKLADRQKEIDKYLGDRQKANGSISQK